MTEAPLSELPRALSRPPWISGRISRSIEPVRVAPKRLGELSPEDVAECVSKLRAEKPIEDVDSTDVALALFGATCVFGGWRSEYDACASQYFEAHVETALLALVPVAIGDIGPRRKIAERFVRQLAAKHERQVRDVAKRYGKRALASIEEILAVDRRFDCPNTPPDLPAIFRKDQLPRPRLHDGRALPLLGVERLGHMLAFSTLDRAYEGLSDVKKICDPRSLAEHAWEMARAWEAEGAISKERWMLESLAHLGDDLVIRRATPALTHPDVVRVIGYVPTNAAATELCTIAWRATHDKGATTFKLASVAAAFAMVARRRGLTVEEQEDSLVPTVAAAEPNDESAPVSSRLAALRAKSIDARVTVEYGARPLVVGFDERLDPFIQTGGGTRLRDLPRPGEADDLAKIARAHEIWRELQEDVAAIADLRIRSLERAMVSGRSWTLGAFRRAWMDHPLMRYVALGVVWRSGSTPFRIAEDGTFADVDDTTLHGVSVVSVAHPAQMTDGDVMRWSSVLADYRIVQPIDQIARRVLRGLSGASAVLVPAQPMSHADLQERVRASGFEIGFRLGKQYVSRKCARSPERLGLTVELANQLVTRFTLVAERSGKPVDLGGHRRGRSLRARARLERRSVREVNHGYSARMTASNVREHVSREEWEQRVALAAAYRLVAHFHWDD